MSCPARSAKEGAAGDGSPARERAERSASLPRHDEHHQRRDEPHSERCGGELRHTQIPVREPAGAELLRVLRRRVRIIRHEHLHKAPAKATEAEDPPAERVPGGGRLTAGARRPRSAPRAERIERKGNTESADEQASLPLSLRRSARVGALSMRLRALPI